LTVRQLTSQMSAVCSFSLICSREIQVWWFYDFLLFIALSEDTSHHDEVLEILNHSHEQIWVHKLHIMMNLTNFFVHTWLDFNDTLSVIQSCQLITLHHNVNFLLLNYNLSNWSNYYNLTEYNLQYQDTSCSQVCNDIKSSLTHTLLILKCVGSDFLLATVRSCSGETTQYHEWRCFDVSEDH
jgi:hypothetical protein